MSNNSQLKSKVMLEILFALMGHVGELINEDFEIMNVSQILPLQEITLINNLLTIGSIYKKINTFIEKINTNIGREK